MPKAVGQYTITDLNDAIIAGTAPTNPTVGALWIKEIANGNDELYKWNGTAWEKQPLSLAGLDPSQNNKLNSTATTTTNIDKVVIPALEGRLEVTEESVKLKAEKSAVDSLTGRVSKAESTITSQANLISTKVSNATFEEEIQNTKDYVRSRGENLVTNGTGLLNNNVNFSRFKFDPTDIYSGGGSFYTDLQDGTIGNDELIPVDPTMKYKFSLMAKSKTGLGKNYFAIQCFDIDGYGINPDNTMFFPDTLTELAKPLNNGDTVVYLKDSSTWSVKTGGNTHQRHFIFWDYTNKKGYSYPPETYSRNSTGTDLWADESVNKTNHTITLRKAWSYGSKPAGTKLSQGSSGSTYKYITASNVNVPTEWTKYEGYIQGIDTTGNNHNSSFHPATAYVKLIFLTNRSTSGGQAGDALWINLVDFSNVSQEEKAKGYTDSSIAPVASRLSKAETSITQQAEAISLKAEKSSVYTKTETDGKVNTAVNSAKSEIKVTTDGISQTVTSLSGKMTGAEGNINNLTSAVSSVDQKADKISQTVTSLTSTVNGQGTRLTNAETSITQHANSINLKANASDVYKKTETDTALGKKVDSTTYNNKMSAIDVSLSGINQTVSNQTTKINDLTNTTTSHTSQISAIDQKADSIELSVKEVESDVSGLASRVGSAETKITANTTAINLKASQTAVDTLGGRVSTAEGQISVQAGQISQRVTKTDFDEAVGVNKWVASKYVITGTDLTTTPPSFALIRGMQATETKEISDNIAPAVYSGTGVITHLFTNVKLNVAKTVSLSVKYDDSVAIFVNGASVYSNKSNSTAVVSVSLSLRAGWNTVEILHGLKDGTPVLNLGTTLSTQVDKMTTVIGVGDKNETRLAQAESSIIQTEKSIALKASNTDVTAIGNRVTATEGSITVLDNQIKSKVSQTDFDNYSKKLTNAESTIVQLSDRIDQTVTKAQYDALNTIVGTQTTKITQLTNQIDLKVNQTDYDKLNGRVSSAETQINLNKNAIALKANQTSLDSVSGRLTTAESSLTVASNQIATKVSQTDFESLEENVGGIETRLSKAESSITQTNQSISLKVNATDVYTKSQVDSEISVIEATANTANANASSAVTTAGTAKSTAETAKSTADTAKSTAETAKSTANTASTNASNAVTTANTASTNASSAVTTANTAKSTADTAKTTADTAKTTADNAKNSIADMTNDLKITPLEKQILSRDWDVVKAEYPKLLALANGLGVSATNLTNAYNLLDSTSPKIASEILSSMTTTYTFGSTTLRDTFKTKLTNYYAQAEDINVAVNNKINSTANTASSNASTAVSTANTASTNASTAVTTANTANSNATTAKSDASTAKADASTAKTNASNAVTTANTASTNASNAVTTANTAKSTADSANTKATNAQNSINDMTSDLKVTPLEKQILSREWEAIKAEYTQLSAQATALSVTATNYTNAYNLLDSTAPKIATDILASLTTTYTFGSTTLRDTFKTKMSAYYTQAETLRKAVTDKINSTANTASSTASTAKATADTANTNANTAKTNASNAVTTANTAKATADTANTTATTASTSASNAVATANTAKTNASNAVTTATTAQNTATAVKNEIDTVNNQFGYRFAKDVIVYGDSDKYYPVIIKYGNQDVKREILIKRGYSEQAPSDWNNATHKGGLTARIRTNFGGWGGANYSWEIAELEEMYSNTFAGAVNTGQNTMFAIFLRGGGTTGAIYHLYSDQQLDKTGAYDTLANGTKIPSPQISYNQDTCFYFVSGSTTYDYKAPAYRTLTSAVQEEIRVRKYVELAKTADSTAKTANNTANTANNTANTLKNTTVPQIVTRVTNAESEITQTKKDIALRVTKQEYEAQSFGSRNLLLKSGADYSTTGYMINKYTLSENWIEGEEYTFVIKGEVPTGQTFGIWMNIGTNQVGLVPRVAGNNVSYVTFKAVKASTGNERAINLYNYPNNTTNATVDWVALYKGNRVPLDWSPAPEDVVGDATKLVSDAKAEIKITTDGISQNVSNLSKTVTSQGTTIASHTSSITTLNNQIKNKVESTHINDAIKGIQLGGRNYLNNSAPAKVHSQEAIGWDETKNGDLVADGWSNGYNGGVTSATTGYHAHVNVDKFGYPVFEFPDLNSVISQPHRWMAITKSHAESDAFFNSLQVGKTYTISMDIMADKADMMMNVGFHHMINGSTTMTFDGYQWNLPKITVANKWERKSYTFTINDRWDLTKPFSLYLYGYMSSVEGTMWVKNIQIEDGNHPSAWTSSVEDIDEALSDLSVRIKTAEQIIEDDNITSIVTNSVSFANMLDEKANAEALGNYATTDMLTEEVEGVNRGIDDKVKAQLDALDLETFEQFVKVKQTATDVTTNFTSAGGVNLIKNSVGFAGMDFWAVSGTLTTDQNGDLDSIGFGSGWYAQKGNSGYIEQVVPVIPNKKYTLSFKLDKSVGSSTNGWAGMDVYYGDGTKIAFVGHDTTAISTGFEDFDYTFTPNSDTIKVRVTIGANAVATVTGVMLNIGEAPLQWTMAHGEVYNSAVQMDMNGIKVTKYEDDKPVKLTVMTPDRFAGYFDVNGDGVIQYQDGSPDEIFKMNEDKFVMKNAVVKEEIEMDTVKIIKINTSTNKGWAFIPADTD